MAFGMVWQFCYCSVDIIRDFIDIDLEFSVQWIVKTNPIREMTVTS